VVAVNLPNGTKVKVLMGKDPTANRYVGCIGKILDTLDMTSGRGYHVWFDNLASKFHPRFQFYPDELELVSEYDFEVI
jgi:hypothetical protein